MTVATEAIATWIVGIGADIYWRAELPARVLDCRLIYVGKDADDFTRPNEDGVFRWRPTEQGAEYLDVQGTAVWTRPDMTRAIHGAAMAANGHRVICEVDDNFLADPNKNIFLRQNGFDADARRAHMKAFASMDAIVCSTEALREYYYRSFRKELKHVPDLYVARNHVDDDDPRWFSREPTWDGVRVGIMGSYQHVADWRLAAPALHLAREMGATVVFMGLDPAEHDPKWRQFLGDYIHIPWTNPLDYHSRAIPFDIGLAPLVTNEHTMGKSDVKALEYAMSGVAAVLQNNVVYNRDWINNETALLAGSPDTMADQVARLISSSRLRDELVQNARQYVAEQRTIQGNLEEWRSAIAG